MYVFFPKGNKILQKYNKIWDTVNDSIKKELDSKSVESKKRSKN